jgi:hypothetical protein
MSDRQWLHRGDGVFSIDGAIRYLERPLQGLARVFRKPFEVNVDGRADDNSNTARTCRITFGAAAFRR